jgi:hypothetical protein
MKKQSENNITANCLRVPISVSLLLVAILAVGCDGTDLLDATSPSTEMPDKTMPVSKPKYVRPKTADNGAPFPTKSGYIKKYPFRFTDGYSSITVDNSKGESDVYVKLYAEDSALKNPVRVFFIRSRERFTAEKVRAGYYYVNFHDLNSGGFFRTKPFELKEISTDTGIQFTRMSLTLYKVPNGNAPIREISAADF